MICYSHWTLNRAINLCCATISSDTTGTVIGPSLRCLAEGSRIFFGMIFCCFKFCSILLSIFRHCLDSKIVIMRV